MRIFLKKVMFWIGKLLGLMLALAAVFVCSLLLIELVKILAYVAGEIAIKYL